MIAEFNWWLLIVGLVVGAGLTWLVLSDGRRREADLEEAELAEEAAWLESAMTEEGRQVDAETAERLLRLHRAYLAVVPPPDDGPWSGDGFEPAEVDLPDPANGSRTAAPSAEPDPPVRTPG